MRFVNDSKATNGAAAQRGIAAYAGQPLRLILGGSLKGESFDELAEGLPASVRSIDLIGEATDELAAALARALERRKPQDLSFSELASAASVVLAHARESAEGRRRGEEARAGQDHH